jgi:hypothetical protein
MPAEWCCKEDGGELLLATLMETYADDAASRCLKWLDAAYRCPMYVNAAYRCPIYVDTWYAT